MDQSDANEVPKQRAPLWRRALLLALEVNPPWYGRIAVWVLLPVILFTIFITTIPERGGQIIPFDGLPASGWELESSSLLTEPELRVTGSFYVRMGVGLAARCRWPAHAEVALRKGPSLSLKSAVATTLPRRLRRCSRPAAVAAGHERFCPRCLHDRRDHAARWEGLDFIRPYGPGEVVLSLGLHRLTRTDPGRRQRAVLPATGLPEAPRTGRRGHLPALRIFAGRTSNRHLPRVRPGRAAGHHRVPQKELRLEGRTP